MEKDLVENKPKINFWKETFRKHSKEEYREFFTRGLDDNKAENNVYPWLYSRVFAICLIIFALFSFIVFMTTTFIKDDAIEFFGYPSLLTVGGMLLNIPMLFLFYELYPKRDISFIKVCFILIICVAFTALFVNLGYCLLMPKNEWLGSLWGVALEEIFKALPALIIIFILKNKSPMLGLLIGAASGIGMAICEDIGYLFISSWNNGVVLPELFKVTLLRTFTSISGHAIWTGLIGWAFNKFNKPLINIKFWLIYLIVACLHYLFNFPYVSLSFLTLLISFVSGLIIAIKVIKLERKKILYPSVIVKPETDKQN